MLQSYRSNIGSKLQKLKAQLTARIFTSSESESGSPGGNRLRARTFESEKKRPLRRDRALYQYQIRNRHTSFDGYAIAEAVHRLTPGLAA